MNLDLKTLIDKLNPTCRKAMEGAAQLCVVQTHYNVEVEHVLARLLEQPDADLHRMFRYYEVRAEDVSRDLTRAMDGFKRGNSRTPALSPHVLDLVQEAWTLASLKFNQAQVGSAVLLLALLEHDSLRGLMLESVPSLLRLPRAQLREDIAEFVRTSQEGDGTGKPVEETGKGAARASDAEVLSPKTPALNQFTVDLTAQARAGKIDPIRGRDFEIRQIVDILTRRRQNNPILTGEAGVGKTAVVEGFALRIAAGDVPPSLKHVSVKTLDLGLLQAGAGVKGEFEDRLKSVINEVVASPKPIILFIDEAHTLIGAGGAAGQGDAANLLKPALARGELRTVAATTWSEYKKYFEQDPALARRFQVVQVDEPSEDAATEMLRGVVETLENHHRVRILDEAVRDAVRLSHRYITGRQLPDKAIGVLDTACARVAIGQTGTPPAVEDAVRQMERLTQEIAILEREEASGAPHGARIEDLTRNLGRAGRRRRRMEARWQRELAAVRKIRALEAQLEGADPVGDDERLNRVVLQGELASLKTELVTLQGDEPMVPTCVDARVVASVVAGWTGIPLGKMLADEIDTILSLKERMAGRIVGQDQALAAVSKRIQTSRADLVDPGKPVGVFLLVGPSGVGKTETAVTLADVLYGGERNMVVVNMSEYQEAFSVSSLRGAPPGYVGYGKGGVLTEAVRRNPYTVVLLDEVEKAHPDVIELFYQVFDKGTMEDGEGVTVSFKNTLILLTSNVGSEAIMRACQNPETAPGSERLVEIVRSELLQYFKPAFLGRLVVVPYYPLREKEIQDIVKLKMSGLQARVRENHRAELHYDEDVVGAIAARCTETESGARNIDHILTHTLLPELSGEVLARMAIGEAFSDIHVLMNAEGDFSYAFETGDLHEGPQAGEEMAWDAADDGDDDA